jgi:hypothetical protein
LIKYLLQTFDDPAAVVSVDATCKISLYLTNWFQRRTFLEIDQQETRIAYGSHVSDSVRILRPLVTFVEQYFF